MYYEGVTINNKILHRINDIGSEILFKIIGTVFLTKKTTYQVVLHKKYKNK